MEGLSEAAGIPSTTAWPRMRIRPLTWPTCLTWHRRSLIVAASSFRLCCLQPSSDDG